MKYGVDLSDDELMNFINKYLMQGGSKNLNCYNNYFKYHILIFSFSIFFISIYT